MHLVKYEIRKHITKFNISFICVMLILNIVITCFACIDHSIDDTKKILSIQFEILNNYLFDEAAFKEAVEDFSRRNSEYESSLRLSALSSDQQSLPIFENKYIDLGSYGDRELFAEIDKTIHRSEDYHFAISDILNKAYSKVRELGIQRGNFVYEYQIALIQNYEHLYELDIPIELVYGWDEFFNLKAPIILLIITSIVVFAGVYLTDKRTGVVSIIRITKNGWSKTAWAKLASTLIISTLLTSSFSLLPLLTIFLTIGLSNPFQYVQAIELFKYCPFKIEIWKFLIIFLSIKILIMFLFALFVTVVSQLSKNEITVYTISLVVVLLNYSLSFISANSPIAFIKKWGLFELLFATTLFDRYRAINLSGYCIGFLYSILLTITIMICVLGLVSILLKYNAKLQYKSAFKESIYPLYKKNRTIHSYSNTYHSLLFFETQKIFTKPIYLCVILLSLVLKIVTSTITFAPLDTHAEQIYKSYISDLSGSITNEKIDYIAEEREYIDTSISEYSKAKDDYINGLIDFDTFDIYNRKYNYSNSVSNSFDRVEDRLSYLSSVLSSETTFNNIEFVYDYGLIKYLSPQMDFILVLLMIVMLCDMFSYEYDSSFAAILRISQKGGLKTFYSKYILSLVISTVFFFIFSVIDIVLLLSYYDMDYLNAGIMSILLFNSTGMNTCILNYIILYKFVSYIGVIILSTLITSISSITKKLPLSIAINIVIIFVPYILSAFEINILDDLNIVYVLSPMLIHNCIIPATLLAFSSFMLMCTSRRIWISNQRKNKKNILRSVRKA